MQPILEHLKKEIALYKEFTIVLQKETEDLINKDYKGLYETVSRKEHIIVRLESLAAPRRHLLLDAASRLGISGEVNLTEIIERLKGPEKEDIKACQSTILSIIESVKEINKVNDFVIKGSLENIKKTLGFLGNFLPRSNYKPSGSFEGFNAKGTRLSEGV